MSALAIKPTAHVVDVLGNVIGRDQPILRMEKALEMVALLGEEVFADENVVFFDPFCKAGELLLACAFHSCWAKSKVKTKILDVEMVMKEIYQSNRYFGLAPDERHHRLSIRTFLGNEHSHNENFNHIIRDGHYLSEEDGKLNREKFEKEFNSMIGYINSKSANKKIVVVGNPPYQEADGGAQSSAKPVYNFFAESLMDHSDISEFVLVIPARWFGAGKGLEGFRERITTCEQIKRITYFQRAEDIFPTIHLQGGACFLHYQKSFDGDCVFESKEYESKIDLKKYDIIPDDPGCYSILEKTKSDISVSSIAWSRKPFGLATDYFKYNKPADKNSKNVIKCYIKNKHITYIHRSEIKKNSDKIDHWKVAIPRAYGLSGRCTLPIHQIYLIEKDAVAIESHNVVGSFKTKAEAENFKNYLQTNFARYLLGLRKITQDIPKDRWNWVPLLDFKTEWTDETLADHFGLTKKEQEHIKKKVQEWS